MVLLDLKGDNMAEKLKIIDTHFHIWDLNRQNLPWLDDVKELQASFSIDDYLKAYEDIDDIDFKGGVYVEVDSDNPYLEDEIIYDIKKNNDKLLGVVARSEVSPSMRLPIFSIGVREPLHVDSSKRGRCLEDSFIEGIKELSANKFTFDSCNRVDELGDLVKLMEKVPDAKVVLNHLGNVESLSSDYKDNMKALAKFPNLYLKVSGYPTGDKKFVKELLQFIKETFSADKLMYASNWPVIKTYSNLKEHLSILREEFYDNEDFFYNNAKRCYGL